MQPFETMKHSSYGMILLCLALLGCSTQVIAKETDTRFDRQAVCRQQLPAKINQLIETTTEGSRWGILIQDSLSKSVIYQRNANQLFIPASNVKLFTTAILLNQLTPEFRVITPIFVLGEAPHLQTLQISGRGDPALSHYDLEQFAETLRQEGVDSIETLVLDTGYFETPAINSTWEWEDVYAAYGTGVNSLILDENAVTLTLYPQKVGAVVQATWDNEIAGSQWKLRGEAITAPVNTDYQVELNRPFGTSQLHLSGTLPQDIERDIWQLAIPNPDHYFRDVLLTQLREKGIQVKQVQFSESDGVAALGEETMAFVSPPLHQLIEEINRNSNNLYAEALLKLLIEEQGEDVIAEHLNQFGMIDRDYSFADGSGLSRRNLVTPRAIAQLLQGMLNHDHGDIFRQSLAVAGVNGTLKNRFQGTSLEGHLQGKTGTLTGISALSGYLKPPQDHPLIFSIMVNHSQRPASEQRAIIDQIVLLLSQLKTCSLNEHSGG